MEDDDEFGDLYTDVLKPFSATSSSAPQVHLISPAPPASLRNNDGGDDEIIFKTSRPNFRTQVQSRPPESAPPAKVGGFVLNSTGGDAVSDNSAGEPRVLERENADLPSTSELLPAEDTDMEFDIEEGIHNQGIPGLSSSDPHDELINLGNTEDARDKDDGEGHGGEEDDWDSDSDDDLRILLNDANQGPMGMDGGGLIGDEDDGGGLNIVVDGDPTHQVMAEQEWADDVSAKVADGEKKEGDEAGKGSAANAVVPKIGYSNHGYQYPFHSQFKYVRPGATPMPGATTIGAGGAPGQVRPPVNVLPTAGRGRGDWRPLGNKSFHPGFGMPGWGNSMGRGFGSGLEFTLPSHKTIFDVDIDTFEEKPWKYPGVDISDFFNFGLNEENWKDYCKQLEQHRLESTMQSRIRVYESGRAEQDYDPDLPPELAAAAGIHDVTAANAKLGRLDVVQSDLAKLPMPVRPPMPTGRPIPALAEGGSGERLPSIDTRPPRIRDSDAIIEIILQDSLEDEYSKGNVVDRDPTKVDIRGSPMDEEDDAQMVAGYFAYDSRKRKLVRRRTPYMDSVNDKAPDRDGVVSFPSEAPLQYPPSSRGHTSVHPSGKPATPEERRTQARDRARSPQRTPSESTHDNKYLDNDEEEAVESTDARHDPMLASPVTVRDELEVSAERQDTVQDEIGLAEGSSGAEKYELISSPNNISRDGISRHAMKNQKPSSQVEQPGLEEPDDAEDSKAAKSSENSKARSGSSRDDQKWQDGIEEEVIQDGHSTRSGSIKRHLDGNQKISNRKDRDTRYETDDTNRMVLRGREDSYSSRDLDPRLSHRLQMKNEGFDRRKGRDNPDGAWQRRDEDPRTRKKPEDTRKRERGDEMGSRHRGKVRESERGDKDDHFHSNKQLDNGSYKVRYEKDVGSVNRERDFSLKNRYEIMDDYHNKRRRDDEYLRRDLGDNEEILHAHRESSSRHKREKDDVFDPRKRIDQQRVRENNDDYLSVRHKDEIWMEREREEWHRLKQSHQENLPKREREEGRAALRSVRGADDRAWAGHARAKDESKGCDKDIQLQDTVRHGDLKRRDRIEDESISHHRGREDVYPRASQFSHAEKRARHERSSSHNDRGISASDNQKVHEKKQKENVRKNKESEGGDHYTSSSSKRNQEDQSGLNEMGLKGVNEQGNGSGKIPNSSSRKHRVDESSDDEPQDSKRGRSKLERWTSHLERDYSIKSKSAASLKFKDMDRNTIDGASEARKPADELIKTVDAVDNQHASVEDKSAGNLETKDGDAKPIDDRHLDTVEKLKKRSERFKLPMPREKDALVIKKIENEALPTATSETHADSEIKPERPARKRRWISN